MNNAYRRLEMDITFHLLKKHLPQTGRVLDAGGRPGRYTITLAQKSYRMTLLDMTPVNLFFAHRRVRQYELQKKVVHIIEGKLQDLSMFEDDIFNEGLCLGGPFSHILQTAEYQTAISELIRVAKPGAPIISDSDEICSPCLSMVCFFSEVLCREMRLSESNNSVYNFLSTRCSSNPLIQKIAAATREKRFAVR